MSVAATNWNDPEVRKPYPGQYVLAVFRHETKGGSIVFGYEILIYEHSRWCSPDAHYRQTPHRWATIMAPQ